MRIPPVICSLNPSITPRSAIKPPSPQGTLLHLLLVSATESSSQLASKARKVIVVVTALLEVNGSLTLKQENALATRG